MKKVSLRCAFCGEEFVLGHIIKAYGKPDSGRGQLFLLHGAKKGHL